MTDLVIDKFSGCTVVRRNTQCLLGERDEEEFPELEGLLKEFVNPSDENPMKASEFLQRVDVRELEEKLRTYYRREPAYPLRGLLSSIAHRKLLKIPWFTRYENYLRTHPDEAVQLGFRERNGVVEVPDHETFRQLEKERLKPAGLNELVRGLVRLVIAAGKRLGLNIGASVGQDSTPLQAKAKDEEAEYNGHYEKRMYKAHVVTDTNHDIPLGECTTPGLDYDGHFLQCNLQKVEQCGAEVEDVYGDQHYGTYENYAFVHCGLDARAHFRLAVDDEYNSSGELGELRRVYQTFWEDADFKPNASDDEVIQFLYGHGETERVGALYRNHAVQEREECPEGFAESLYPRTKCEGSNGHWKENLDFEHSFKKKGLVNAAIHVSATCFAVLLVALTRLQHGVTTGLTRLAGLN